MIDEYDSLHDDLAVMSEMGLVVIGVNESEHCVKYFPPDTVLCGNWREITMQEANEYYERGYE